LLGIRRKIVFDTLFDIHSFGGPTTDRLAPQVADADDDGNCNCGNF